MIDGVIFYDLDRLVRQPRDLEDLIDIVEYVQRPVTGATGGRMNLINDNDRHMARMMCVMALKSSEDTARRVARQHLSAARDGEVQGRIAYGWIRKGEHKGQLVPEEADVVARIFQDFLAGESAYSIAKAFNIEGIEPPAAKTWSSTVVAKMLHPSGTCGLRSPPGSGGSTAEAADRPRPADLPPSHSKLPRPHRPSGRVTEPVAQACISPSDVLRS
ncbi:recombinase family protein [Streptomyces sp. NPDC050161]|uniref:recombinase family protein n=1 Tax=Streptomyces sp. NPDC050161 TaxID=3365604 RepID=UPI0037A45A24